LPEGAKPRGLTSKDSGQESQARDGSSGVMRSKTARRRERERKGIYFPPRNNNHDCAHGQGSTMHLTCPFSSVALS
jgi:hypothetical protein